MVKDTNGTRHPSAGPGRAIIAAACCVLMSVVLTVFGAKNQIADSDITNAVETNLLFEEGVSSHLIDVSTNNGVVTLSGTVSNILEKDRAVDVTEHVKGVRSIVDKVEVRPVVRPDYEIEQDILSSLAMDPATEVFEVSVKVDEAVVRLTGEVDSYAEKILAEKVAKRVRGVQQVINEIDYVYTGSRSDADIKADVRMRLKWDPRIDDELIDIKVDKGVVKLSGTIGSMAEQRAAENKAQVVGAVRVDTRGLKVRPWAEDKMIRKKAAIIKRDSEIKQAALDAMIADPRVASFKIQVSVEDAEVILTGTVDNLKAKRAAANAACNTAGVWNVNNKIKVRPAKDEDSSDAELAAKVAKALSWDPVVERHEVGVTVRNRKAYLRGNVDNIFEKRQAEDVASRVNGIVSVLNSIVINREWPYKSDEEIEAGINDEWFWSPFVDGGDLSVGVEEGEATIVGTVDDYAELVDSVENAFEGGAHTVYTHVRVEENDRVAESFWAEPPGEY